jgi:SAM-dependent methyltransferase
LDVGAGTGRQALELSRKGFCVEAIDLAGSLYSGTREFPVVDYDGLTIPFPDQSFDYVFSSNLLEHVPDLTHIQAEFRRVLKTDGQAIHVLPTHFWRLWTILSAFPAAIQSVSDYSGDLWPRTPISGAGLRQVFSAWFRVGRCLISPLRQSRHGERGTVLSEAWLFHPSWWRRNFEANGFLVAQERPMGLFYTGHMIMARKWGIGTRTHLARLLGSACHVFVLKPQQDFDVYRDTSS